MTQDTITYLKNEIQTFEEMTQKFLNKEISMKEYKGFSGGYGSYAQRDQKHFMLRLRMNQGVITKEKLAFTLHVIEKYHIPRIHFTTCQTIQLHNVEGNDLGHIMREALDHDIVTRGGGGDFPRNVMCSPLSGVQKNEYFNVLPYAKAVGDYVLEKIHTYKLPRKLKIAFSSNDENKPHATFRDLGFCANFDGTFDVYIAGGLGKEPKMGICVASSIDPCDVLYHVEAMIQMFQKHGNYENRAKARTRFMQETLGVDGCKEIYRTFLEETKKLSLTIPKPKEDNITKKGNGTINHPQLIAQKQEGLYALHLHPCAGDITKEVLQRIALDIAEMEQVELRISPQQDLYIINLTAQEAKKLLPLCELYPHTNFSQSVSCIGAGICQVGLRDSNHLLHQLLQNDELLAFADGILPRLHISGCPSSCGTHQIAEMGMQGSIKLVDKKPQPAFIISILGNDTRKNAQFALVCDTILEAKIPDFLKALGKQIQKRNMTFAQYKILHKEELIQLIQTYANA